MIECDLQLIFTIAGPYLSRSSTTGGYGIDAVPLRDAQGRPLLPGSHVRGRIRESLDGSHDRELPGLWQMSGKPALAEQWIGPAPTRDDVEPDVGLRRFGWHFGDFSAPLAAASGYTLTRIELDDESGSAKSGALQVIEPAVPPGESAEFTGMVTVSAANEVELAEAVRWLLAGARCVPSLGSFRNVGFGRVTNVTASIVAARSWHGAIELAKLAPSGVTMAAEAVVRSPRAAATAVAAPPKTSHRLLRVTMHEPFCVGGKRRDRNTIESLRHLTGAVLKGAVAHLLARIHGLSHRADLTKAGVTGRWSLLCRHFSAWQFRTAFPANADVTSRPLVAPLSLFKIKQGGQEQVRDAARIGGPFLIWQEKKDEQPERWISPAFSPDWKSHSTPGWDAGMAEPAVELRIRTSIDSAARRVRDEHLFAMEMVRPGALHWLGSISLDAASLSESDQARLWDDLESLLEIAVLRIGKTKSRATFSLQNVPPTNRFSSSAQAVDGRWVVVLQSPALLVDPRKLHDQWTRGVDATEALYKEAFAELSGGQRAALVLVDHFADQQLHGGFLAVRDQPQLISSPEKYAPLLTTEAGSVFVLRAMENRDADAQAIIDRWLQSGLPLPAWAKDRHGEDFQTNPFLPQDGFGEIAVNVPAQLELAPSDTEIKKL